MAEFLNRLCTAFVGGAILLIAAAMMNVPNNPARQLLEFFLGEF